MADNGQQQPTWTVSDLLNDLQQSRTKVASPDSAAQAPTLAPPPSGSGYPDPAVPGNIQWRNRPNVPMPDGSYGTVFSASRDEDGKEVLYPRIYDGALHSDDEAWQRYRQTGRHMGKFKSVADANAYAQKYHLDAAAGKFGATPPGAPPPSQSGTQNFDDIIHRAATEQGVDQDLIKAMLHQESGGNPQATSKKGAAGLMQLMPDTARGLGVTDAYDPEQNIRGGVKYMKEMLDRYDGNVKLALAAYNSGPGAVDLYHDIPPYPETQDYVSRIMGRYQGTGQAPHWTVDDLNKEFQANQAAQLQQEKAPAAPASPDYGTKYGAVNPALYWASKGLDLLHSPVAWGEEALDKGVRIPFTEKRVTGAIMPDVDWTEYPDWVKSRPWLVGVSEFARGAGKSTAQEGVRFVSDPLNWPFLLVGMPELGSAGAVRPMLRAAVDTFFGAMMAQGTYQNIAEGNYSGAAMNAAFGLMGLRGLHENIRLIEPMKQFDTAAKETFGKPWFDLTNSQKNTVLVKVQGGNRDALLQSQAQELFGTSDLESLSIPQRSQVEREALQRAAQSLGLQVPRNENELKKAQQDAEDRYQQATAEWRNGVRESEKQRMSDYLEAQRAERTRAGATELAADREAIGQQKGAVQAAETVAQAPEKRPAEGQPIALNVLPMSAADRARIRQETAEQEAWAILKEERERDAEQTQAGQVQVNDQRAVAPEPGDLRYEQPLPGATPEPIIQPPPSEAQAAPSAPGVAQQYQDAMDRGDKQAARDLAIQMTIERRNAQQAPAETPTPETPQEPPAAVLPPPPSAKEAAIESAKQEAAPKPGGENTLFTEERLNAALAKLKKYTTGEKLNSGIDPEAFMSLIDVGGYYFERGLRDFAGWSAQVVKDVGPWVQEHLENVFAAVQEAIAREQAAKAPPEMKAAGEQLNAAKREAKLREASETMRTGAKQAATPEAADGMATAAAELARRAERARVEREDAERRYQQAAGQPTEQELGPPLPVLAQGRSTNIIINSGLKYPAHYAVVRERELIPSHEPDVQVGEWKKNVNAFQPRENYAETEKQQAIIMDSQRVDERPLSDDVTHNNGPAIVRKDGVVAGGNRRTMMLRLAYKQNNRSAHDYYDLLQSKAASFGIDPLAVPAYSEHPVLVRVLDDVHTDRSEMYKVGDYLNTRAGAAYTEAEKQVAASKYLTDQDFDTVVGYLSEGKEGRTIAELIREKHDFVVGLMSNSGMVKPGEEAAYFKKNAEGNRVLTDEGKDLFRQAVMGRVLSDAALAKRVDEEIPSIGNKVERTLDVWARIAARKDSWNFIKPYLDEALRLHLRIKNARGSLDDLRYQYKQFFRDQKDNTQPLPASDVELYLHQEKYPITTRSMDFGDGPIRDVHVSPIAEALAKLLEEKTGDIRDTLTPYIKAAEITDVPDQGGFEFFEPADPWNVFNQYVGKPAGVQVSRDDWGRVAPAPAKAPEYEGTDRRQSAQAAMDRRIMLGVKLGQLREDLRKEADPAKRDDIQHAINREIAVARNLPEPQAPASAAPEGNAQVPQESPQVEKTVLDVPPSQRDVLDRRNVAAYEAQVEAQKKRAQSPKPQQEKPAARSYQDVQDAIDTRESELEKQGVDVAKLHHPETPVDLPGYKPMPDDLAALYRERDAIGGKELAQSVGDIQKSLAKVGITGAEADRIMDGYALRPGKSGAADQYMAGEHAQRLAAEPLNVQVEKAYTKLAAERGIPMDNADDLFRDKKTTLGAARAVKAVVSYFTGQPIDESKLLPYTPLSPAGKTEPVLQKPPAKLTKAEAKTAVLPPPPVEGGEHAEYVDPQWVAEEIDHGRADANLIAWADPGAEKHDSKLAIAEARKQFEAAGWKWNANDKQLEKDGWYLWFRSQGELAPPIAQWDKIENRVEAPPSKAEAGAPVLSPPPGSKRAKQLLDANQISDFRPGIDKVVRQSDGRTFVVDGEGQRARVEVKSDVLTPEVRERMERLSPEQRDKMIEATRNYPYLSEEGRKERLAVLRESKGAVLSPPPKAEVSEPRYKFGNTQAAIAADSEAGKALEAARQRIADSDLAGDGKDIGGNHVTVRYGIQGEDTAGIKKFIESQAPFEARLGKTEAFKPSEHSDGAAPIIAPVEAPELRRIEAEMDQHGDFAERSFPEYKPHATIAYVAPEKAGRYTGMDVTAGKSFTVDTIAITDRNGREQLVKLKGKPESETRTAEIPPLRPHAAETSKEVAAVQQHLLNSVVGGKNIPVDEAARRVGDESVPTVILARHGTTKLNGRGGTSAERIRGWSDIDLDASGVKDAERLGQQLKNVPIDRIITSDLTRAVHTGEIIGKATGKPVETRYELRPWDLGDFTAKEVPGIKDKLEYYIQHPNETVPGGESYSSFLTRYTGAMQDILKEAEESGKTPVVVAHSRNLLAVPNLLSGGKEGIAPNGGPEPGQAVLLEKGAKGWRLADKAEGAQPKTGAEKQGAQLSSRSALRTQIATAFPKTTPEQREGAIALMEMRAKAMGMTLPEFTAKHVAGFEFGGEPGKGALAQADVNSPEFQKWFGKSKVVEKDGSPKVLYHGTNAEDFSEFNTSPETFELGSHFGTKEQANSVVQTWGGEPREGNPPLPGARAMPVFVRIEHPLRLRDMGDFTTPNVVAQLVDRGLWDEEGASVLQHTGDYRELNDAIKETLKDNGYDGIVYLNRREGTGSEASGLEVDDSLSDKEFKKKYPSAADSYVVLDPEQIKSAIGNRGTFDPNNPDILAQAEADKPVWLDKLREMSEPDGIRELSKDYFGAGEGDVVPPLSVMDAAVISSLNNDKVLKGVVGFLPVDVVDVLAAKKISPEEFTRNPNMFRDILPVDTRVAVRDGVLSALTKTGARIRAGLDLGYKTGTDAELLPALHASDLDTAIAARIFLGERPLEQFDAARGTSSTGALATTESSVVGVSANGGAVRNGETAPAELTDFSNWHRGIVEHLDPETQTLEQGKKGVTEFLQDGRAVVRGFASGDISTLAHESAHIFRRTLSPEELETANQTWGVRSGKWTMQNEERFARDFERYLYDGKAPSPEAKGIFAKFRGWLQGVYTRLIGSPIADKISAEKRDFFNQMLGFEKTEAEPVSETRTAPKAPPAAEMQVRGPPAKEPWETPLETLRKSGDAAKAPAGNASYSNLEELLAQRAKTDNAIAFGQGGGENLAWAHQLRDQLDAAIDKAHRDAVQQALAEGRPVPKQVLADYPDLQKGAAAAPAPAPEAAAAKEGVLPPPPSARAPRAASGDIPILSAPPKPKGGGSLLVGLNGEPLGGLENAKRIARAWYNRDDAVAAGRSEAKRPVLSAPPVPQETPYDRMVRERQPVLSPPPKKEASSVPQATPEPRIILPPGYDSQEPRGERAPARPAREIPDGRTGPENGRGTGPLPGPTGESGRVVPKLPEPAPTVPAGRVGESGAESVEREKRKALRGVQDFPMAKPRHARGQPLYDPERWRQALKATNLPENLPVPTERLDEGIRERLYPGQRLAADVALSALKEHDATTLALSTGSGKTYVGSALFAQLKPKYGLILVPQRDLLKDWKNTASGHFGVEVKDLEDATPKEPGIYITTYSASLNRKSTDARQGLDKFPWDLVFADESTIGRGWHGTDHQTGEVLMNLGEHAKKMVYSSATPFHTPLEVGYMNKLGLWDGNDFGHWSYPLGVRRAVDNKGNARWYSPLSPRKMEKLREQLVERGQMITMERDMRGYAAHFGIVPLTEGQKQQMNDARRAFSIARSYFTQQKLPGLIRAAKAIEATYIKNYLERARLPQAVELGKRLEKAGYKVIFFTENKGKPEEEDAATDQHVYDFIKDNVDAETRQKISQLLTPLPSVVDTLERAFPGDVANYSGSHSAERSAEKDAFNSGEKKHIYTTYAAGGVGVSLHDTYGDAPRAAVHIGLPWSGVSLDQALGRPWRFGTKSDVAAYFLTSDARPEIDLITKKVGPRLASLRAGVSGIKPDAIVSAMHNPDPFLDYSQGGAHASATEDYFRTGDPSIIAKHNELPITPSKEMVGPEKGMKIPDPGETPELKFLFQGDGGEDIKKVQKSAEKAMDSPGIVPPPSRQSNETYDQVRGILAGVPQLARLSQPQRASFADAVSAGVSYRAAAAAGDGGDPTPAIVGAWQDAADHVRNAGTTSRKAASGFFLNYLVSGRNGIRRVGGAVGEGVANDIVNYHLEWGRVGGPMQVKAYDIYNEAKIKPDEFRQIVNAIEEQEKTGSAVTLPDRRLETAKRKFQGLMDETRRALRDAGVTTEVYQGGQKVRIPIREEERPGYFPHRYSAPILEAYRNIREAATPEARDKAWSQAVGQIMRSEGIGRVDAEQMLKSAGIRSKVIDRQHDQMIENLMDRNGVDRAAAETMLADMSRGVPLASNIERPREANLPGYRKDFGALLDYLDDGAEVIARTKIFGQNREKLSGKLSTLDDPKAITFINDVVSGLLDRKHQADTASAMARAAADWTIWTKMLFSAIPNASQWVNASLRSNTRSSLKSLAYSLGHMHDATRAAMEAGVITEHARADLMRELGVSRSATQKFLENTGFLYTDLVGRVIAYHTGRVYLEDYALPKLIKDPQSAYRRILKQKYSLSDAAIDSAIRRKQWTADDLRRAGKRLSDDTQFTNDPTEKPPAWSAKASDIPSQHNDALIRIATLLKSYAYKQSALIGDALWREAVVHHNFRPLIPFAVLFPVVGELVADLSQAVRQTPAVATAVATGDQDKLKAAALAGTERVRSLADLSTDDKWALLKRYVDNIGHVGGIGLAGSVIDAASWNKIPEFLIGPAGADAAYTFSGGARVVDALSEGNTEKAGNAAKGVIRKVLPATKTILPVPPR